MQDRCPSFAPHVFAISAVSGGSLGAAAFAGTAGRTASKKEAGATGKCLTEAQAGKLNRAAMRDFLAHNFLSAPFIALLNFDLPLYAMGLPVNPFDRAVALETAIEHVWDKTAPAGGGEGYFSQSVKSAWQPDSMAPMINYNATLIDRGEPVLISPIGWSYRSRSGSRGYALSDLRSSGVRTSTAVVLSARFPYLAPLAVLKGVNTGDGPRGEITRIGDGGYFDNSGIVSAAELVASLSAILEARKLRDAVDVYLISFVDEVARTAAASSFGEIVSPIDAVQRVRERRASELVALYADLPVRKWWRRGVSSPEFDPPLGWAISAHTMKRIEQNITARSGADVGGQTGQATAIDEIASMLELN
jgi:hypothetical protein